MSMYLCERNDLSHARGCLDGIRAVLTWCPVLKISALTLSLSAIGFAYTVYVNFSTVYSDLLIAKGLIPSI